MTECIVFFEFQRDYNPRINLNTDLTQNFIMSDANEIEVNDQLLSNNIKLN